MELKKILFKKNQRKIFQILISTLLILLISCNNSNNSNSLSLIPVRSGENYQYINLKGDIKINPQFSDVSVFRNGIALVKSTGQNSKWGFINEDGKYIINPIYKSATIFSENIAFVIVEHGAPLAINKDGKVLFTLKDTDEVNIFKDGLAGYMKITSEEKWGFIDTTGKIIINEQFAAISNFSENKCAVKNKYNKWGYINKKGQLIINYQFDEAQNFQNNTAVVYLNEQAGVINENGKFIINPQYSYLKNDTDMYLFKQDNKRGWCDKSGKIIINPQFSMAYNFFGNNLASFKTDGKFGYIDKLGKILINPQFDEAYTFNNKVALVASGDKYGFIDNEGKYIVNPQYDMFSYDYLNYVNNGETIYNSVQTDFIDIEKIAQSISLNIPYNLTFENNFTEILSKFSIDSESLNKYEQILNIYKEKKISKNATLSFNILGQFFLNNSDYVKEFVGTNKPRGFAYEILLKENAIKRNKDIQELLIAKLKKYKFIKKGFYGKNEIYVCKNDSSQIIIDLQDEHILFYILNKNFDITDYLNQIKLKYDEKLDRTLSESKSNSDKNDAEEAAIEAASQVID